MNPKHLLRRLLLALVVIVLGNTVAYLVHDFYALPQVIMFTANQAAGAFAMALLIWSQSPPQEAFEDSGETELGADADAIAAAFHAEPNPFPPAPDIGEQHMLEQYQKDIAASMAVPAHMLDTESSATAFKRIAARATPLPSGKVLRVSTPTGDDMGRFYTGKLGAAYLDPNKGAATFHSDGAMTQDAEPEERPLWFGDNPPMDKLPSPI